MNKITKEFLESEIIAVEYKRLSERLTHCTITVKNGFQFTGESACVDPAAYNEDIGNKIAYNNAFDKMWMPYGFWLRQKMHDEGAFSNVEATSKADDEPYQIKDTDQFTLELAITLAQNGDVVRNVNTGTTLSLDDCRHDAFWQLAQAPKAEDLPAVSAVNPIVYSQEHLRPPTMDFGYAVKIMKDGKRVSRIGWNGKGMFLSLVKGRDTDYHVNSEVFGTGNDGNSQDQLPVLDAIYMKTADNKLVPWLASQTDVLAEDWQIG